MAPPRRILRQQLEILLDFIEENKDMAKGLPPGAPISHQETRQKWAVLARKLNAVQSGATKTPDGWKKYWFEWRHKCKKKAADSRRFQTGADSGRNRFVPINDLEVRVLELSGKGSVSPRILEPKTDSFLNDDNGDDDSDSEQTLEVIKAQSAPVSVKTTRTSTTKIKTDIDSRSGSPPPRWAIELEERRIAAEERMAEALASMADVMRSQEERRAMLDERIADALTTIAGTVQDLNSGIQEAVQHLQQLYPVQTNGPDLKGDVFFR